MEVAGTTFLQRRIFPKTSLYNLGKPRNLSDDKLMKLQYKVFFPKYSFNNLYPLNMSKHVREYSYKLIEEINSTNKRKFYIIR